MYDKRLRTAEKPFRKCQTNIRSINVDSNKVRKDVICVVFFGENHILSKSAIIKQNMNFFDETLIGAISVNSLDMAFIKSALKIHCCILLQNEHVK